MKLIRHIFQILRRAQDWVRSGTVVIACLAPAFTASGHAQGFGTISGTVADPSRAVIPGATVVATETHNGQTTQATSGGNGRFTFPTLLPSTYAVKATANGFEAYNQQGIVLQANQALTVNIKVQLGSTAQTVSVWDNYGGEQREAEDCAVLIEV